MATDNANPGGQPRVEGATADAGNMGGPSIFDLAVDICHGHYRRGQSITAMHQTIMDALDARLDPPDDTEPLDPDCAPCNCPDDRCRC